MPTRSTPSSAWRGGVYEAPNMRDSVASLLHGHSSAGDSEGPQPPDDDERVARRPGSGSSQRMPSSSYNWDFREYLLVPRDQAQELFKERFEALQKGEIKRAERRRPTPSRLNPANARQAPDEEVVWQEGNWNEIWWQRNPLAQPLDEAGDPRVAHFAAAMKPFQALLPPAGLPSAYVNETNALTFEPCFDRDGRKRPERSIRKDPQSSVALRGPQ
mmetsp:Transcript_63294/g.145558  ORF Transcript_63294/g.145558 Transcript_63294/m.145558 type:complete len:216 (-) Transcript_63294:121-768(-)